MPKTILSTADVARMFSVTETTVKRWADVGTLKCQKTPGGHRKFNIRDVVEFASSYHFEPTGVLTLSDKDKLASSIQTAILARDFDTLRKAFVEKALSPDRKDLFTFFSFLYQHKIELWEIYDLVLRQGMYELGEQWEKNLIGVYQEHRASHETLDALSKLQAQVVTKGKNGFQVVFACLEDELHDIGLRCAANIFDSEGWTVHYLGGRTPHTSVLDSIRDIKPELVCLSLTLGNGAATRRQLKEIQTAVRSAKGALMLGGQGVLPAYLDKGLCDGVYTSSKEVLDDSRKIVHERTASREHARK